MAVFRGALPARTLVVVAVATVTLVAALAWTLPVQTAQAQRTQPQTTLRFVPQADLKNTDPVWTTAAVTQTHGFMILVKNRPLQFYL